MDIVQRFKLGDRILPAGSHLYRPGESCTELYNLLDGWAAQYRILTSGRRQILDFGLPGSFLGYQPDPDGPMLHGVECLTDVSVCVFPGREFPDLIEQNSRLAVSLAKLNAIDTVKTQDHLTNVGSRSAEARVGHLLLELCSRLNSRTSIANDEEFEIPLTQYDIADALGLSSVYVSQTLKHLRQRGLLMFKNGRLQIFSLSGLRKAADFDEVLVV